MEYNQWRMEPNQWRGSRNFALICAMVVALLSYFLFGVSLKITIYILMIVFIASFSFAVYWFATHNKNTDKEYNSALRATALDYLFYQLGDEIEDKFFETVDIDFNDDEDLVRAKENILKEIIRKHNITRVELLDGEVVDISNLKDEEIAEAHIRLIAKKQAELHNEIMSLKNI